MSMPRTGRRHCRLIGHILHEGLREREDRSSKPRLVDGRVLMQALGLSPGPELGRLLEAIMEAQGAGEVSTREEALDLASSLLSDPSTGYSQAQS